MQTIILGLDGANWDLLSPWISSGKLNNIKELKENGVVADHHSVLPPVTCPNWRAYSTGKNPGKLGVYWFENIDTESQSLTLPNSESFKSKDMWDYMNADGQTCGVMNLPMSYPPRELDKLMVAGGPRSGDDGYTYPDELEEELESAFDYRVHPNNMITSNENSEDEVTLIHELIETRFEAAKYLIDEYNPDVFHLTIFYINVLQHYFWRDEPVEEAWEIIDEYIGDMVDRAENVILLSDHGCAPVETVFNINAWLESEGYLTTNTTATDYLYKAGITQERMAKIARLTHMERPIRKLLSQKTLDLVPGSEGVKRHEKLKKVDWNETKAIASGQGPIYLAIDKDDPEYESVRDEIISKLESLTDTRNGQQIARAVYKAEEEYEGEYVSDGPDIIFDQEPGVHTSGAVGMDDVFEPRGKWKAENVRTGLFLASGPDFRTGQIDSTISITDIAPTILHALGHQIPDDMDGTVIDVFQPDSEPGKSKPEFCTPIDRQSESRAALQDEVARERLEDIGYL
ncbi:alkaline phosphatase family protein [Haloarcula laminariae]|uniref:alkaline phosphatase family protein n=1 Tax=Haloarcula laminariae TaxID=2961577 RepID=UPI0024070A1B|nr:alkaline phosphatase family protein [Halomicroarcula sp. FL173]